MLPHFILSFFSLCLQNKVLIFIYLFWYVIQLVFVYELKKVIILEWVI